MEDKKPLISLLDSYEVVEVNILKHSKMARIWLESKSNPHLLGCHVTIPLDELKNYELGKYNARNPNQGC